MQRTLFTVTEFAKMENVTRDTIYKWMNADKMPSGSRVKKVAGRNFISVSAGYLARFAMKDIKI